MSLTNAICPKCNTRVMVDASDDATICKCCGKPFITAKAVAAFAALQEEPGDDSDVFPQPYRIFLRREKNPIISNSVTFILIENGRPRPLADDAYTTIIDDRKRFEIPVWITDNKKKRFEGVLTGIADGKDISILWSVEPKHKALGLIKETTNSTVCFEERPGATRW